MFCSETWRKFNPNSPDVPDYRQYPRKRLMGKIFIEIDPRRRDTR